MTIKNHLQVFLPILLNAWKSGASYQELFRAIQGFNNCIDDLDDSDIEWLASYQHSLLPGSCICGNAETRASSGLHYHCQECKGKYLMSASNAIGQISLPHFLTKSFWIVSLANRRGMLEIPLWISENILIEYFSNVRSSHE